MPARSLKIIGALQQLRIFLPGPPFFSTKMKKRLSGMKDFMKQQFWLAHWHFFHFGTEEVGAIKKPCKKMFYLFSLVLHSKFCLIPFFRFFQFCLVRKVKCLIIESGQKKRIFRRTYFTNAVLLASLEG